MTKKDIIKISEHDEQPLFVLSRPVYDKLQEAITLAKLIEYQIDRAYTFETLFYYFDKLNVPKFSVSIKQINDGCELSLRENSLYNRGIVKPETIGTSTNEEEQLNLLNILLKSL